MHHHVPRIDAQDLAEFIFARVIAFVNMPKNLVSDRGSIFSTKFIVNLVQLSRAKRHLSVTIHPNRIDPRQTQKHRLIKYLVNGSNWHWGTYLLEDTAALNELGIFLYLSFTHNQANVFYVDSSYSSLSFFSHWVLWGLTRTLSAPYDAEKTASPWSICTFSLRGHVYATHTP